MVTSEERDTHGGERKDASLVALGKIGDAGALDDLVRLYWRDAYNGAMRVLRCHEDAEDVAQDALFSAIVHLDAFSERASFRTWLNRIVLNQSLMLLRHRRSCALDLSCVLDEKIQVAEAQESPEDAVVDAERKRLLSTALRTLPGFYGIPLLLFTYQQQSVNDIAQHLGISRSAVKIRLHRARNSLSSKAASAVKHTSARVVKFPKTLANTPVPATPGHAATWEA